eukprot:scaffold209_cov396-Prasinococcus_capsulatus_cf.AAC.14
MAALHVSTRPPLRLASPSQCSRLLEAYGGIPRAADTDHARVVLALPAWFGQTLLASHCLLKNDFLQLLNRDEQVWLISDIPGALERLLLS